MIVVIMPVTLIKLLKLTFTTVLIMTVTMAVMALTTAAATCRIDRQTIGA